MTEKLNIIVYNTCTLPHYKEYGIDIPMFNERVTKTFAMISKKYGVSETPKENFFRIGLEDLALVHDSSYLDEVRKDPDQVVLKTYELLNTDGSYNRYDPAKASKPLSDFILRALSHVNGTIFAAQTALETGVAYHLGGGMHHAMSFKPGGFCMFNDIVMAIRVLQRQGKIKNAIVIDMDAHKGDGTAEITVDDDSIRTFSIHMKEGWPLDKSDSTDPSFTPSTLDLGVLPGDDYLKIFKNGLRDFVGSADLAIVVHGADVYELDQLESSSLIKLSKKEVLQRDEYVFELLKSNKIPQAWVMAGGYGSEVHEIFTQTLDLILSRR